MVRKTESRLPDGYSAADLGQAVSVNASPGEYHLVSYLTSPVARGSYNDYVVFATNGAAEPDHYLWTFRCVYTNKTYISNYKTYFGTFRFRIPKDAKRIEVKAELCDTARNVLAVLTMEHDITDSFRTVDAFMRPLLPGITDIDKYIDAGHPDTTREILDNFRIYIEEAAFKEADRLLQLGGAEGVPPAFVAAIVYKEAIFRPYLPTLSKLYCLYSANRSTELELAADEINGVPGSGIFPQWDNSLGVCQIKPFTLAMHLGHITFRELPKTGNRKAVEKRILEDYKANIRGTDTEVDLYNLLRFPKSNILMCAKILNGLKNRPNRWPDLSFNDFMNNDKAISVIATEYSGGPTTSSRDDAGPSDYGRDVLKYTKSHLIKYFFTHSEKSYMIDSSVQLGRGSTDGLAWVLQGNTGAPVVRNYVSELQADLFNLGFLDSEYINGYFGPETEAAVIAFRTYARENVRINRYTMEEVTTDAVFTGNPVGTVDAAVAAEIKKWLKNGWIGKAPYGGYTFRIGDNDDEKVYGGVRRPDPIGNYIHELQRDLLSLGYWISTPVTAQDGKVDSHGTVPDGRFSDSCAGSIYLFQREHGLTPNGELDSMTRSVLKQVVQLTKGQKYRRPGHDTCIEYLGVKYDLTLYQLPPSEDYFMKNANKYLHPVHRYIDNAWGQLDMIKMLEKTASEWVRRGNEHFTIVDLSHDDGSVIVFDNGKKKHHPLGAKVDINSWKYCNILSNDFDRHKSLELANLFLENKAERILFNCAYVSDNAAREPGGPRKVKPAANHHHHFHIDTFLIPDTRETNPAYNPKHFCKWIREENSETGEMVEVHTNCKKWVDPQKERSILDSEWREMEKSMTPEEKAAITDRDSYVREHSTKYCFYEKRAGYRTAADNQ